MTTRLKVMLTAAAASAAVTLLAAAQEGTPTPPRRSTREGVYTAEQAQRGAQVAVDACQRCHPPDYYKGRTVEAWEGNTVAAFLDSIAETMPQNRPSSLKPQEYADIVAYIFELNNYPTGKNELRGDRVSLARILIEGGKGKKQ